MINKKNILYKPSLSVYNLQYQLFFFLKSKKKDLVNLPNNIINMNYFLKFIKEVHNRKFT